MKKYPKKSKAVYFFGTCLVDLFYPEAGMAGIKLLQREGLEFFRSSKHAAGSRPSIPGSMTKLVKLPQNKLSYFQKIFRL
jgi:L-lactate dehydrogenase complex protein LldE